MAHVFPDRPKPLRVIHVAGTADGAPWMHQQVRELRARGHDATGIIAGAHGTLAPRFERDGIPYDVRALDIFAGRNPIAAAIRVLSLARLLRRARPDVVHSHLFGSIILTRLAAWLADVPVRVSMIPGTYILEAPLLSDVDVRTTWMDTKVIASCERTRTLYAERGVPADRVELIYYGQDIRVFDPARADGARVRRELGIAPDRPVVGDVAYFYPPQSDSPFTPPHLIGRGIKGHEVLLRAVPHVLAEEPDALFLLVGEGWGPDGRAYQAELEALAADLGIADAVRFTGARTDIPDTLMAFDVSIQCSLNENLGGSIESLLMARPFIASAVGGLVDAVQHEHTGLLVSPGDSIALAQAIVRLLRDRALGQRLGENGRQQALARFTLSKAVDDLEALYARESETARRTDGEAYRLSRTVWRALYLSVWAWTLAVPMLIAKPRRMLRRLLHAVRDVVRGEDLIVWGRTPRTGAANANGVRAPRIVQMAGITENGDWLVSICRELREQGHDVAAIIGGANGSVAAGLRKAGVPFQALPLSFAQGRGRMRLLVYAVRMPLAVLRLALFFRRERVDIVHTHVLNTILIGRLAAWLARVPCRVSMVTGPLHLEAPFTRGADRMTWWIDRRVIAGCKWTRDRYRELGLHESRLSCIRYGSDPARFDPARANPARIRRELRVTDDVPLIGLVAYFYPPRTDWQTPPHMRGRGVKGHEDFLAAARLVRQRCPAARFLLVGGGWGAAGERYRQQLVACCREDGLGDAVVFMGRRHDVPDILAALDIAVQCSLSENYGGTIESLLMQRPTIATRIGGMPETVRHGETGLLVPPRDPEALAAAVLESLDDRPRAHAMAAAGRRLMLDRFQIAHTAREIALLYERLLARPAIDPERSIARPRTLP